MTGRVFLLGAVLSSLRVSRAGWNFVRQRVFALAAPVSRRSPGQDRELPGDSTSRRSNRAALWRRLALGTSRVGGRSAPVH